MDAVIPWQRLLRRIEPHYPRGENGRPPMPLAVMLRVCFMQQWFNLSDEQRGVRYRVNRHGTVGNPVSERWRLINRARSRIPRPR